jgi:hypothetical protein
MRGPRFSDSAYRHYTWSGGLFGSVFEVSGARETRDSGGREIGLHGFRPELARACCCSRRGTAAARGTAARSRSAESRWPRRSQLPPRSERANGGRGPMPPSIGGGGPRTSTGMGAGARQPMRLPRGSPATRTLNLRDARAEGGSGAAQGRGSDPRGAERRMGRGLVPGTDRQEAGSPRAGPGGTGFGWAPPYLRSRLA